MMGRITLAIALGACFAGVVGCRTEEKLGPPFSYIIPSCQSTAAAQKGWFEHPNRRPITSWPIETGAERACKGDDIKLWMQMYRFATESDASSFVTTCDRSAEIGLSCQREDDWPFATSGPDEAHFLVVRDFNAVSQAFYFRVGRWAGFYEVQDTSEYRTEGYTYIGVAAWETLYRAMDATTPRLRSQQ